MMINEVRFIPFRRADFHNMCLQPNELSAIDKKRFRVFFILLQALRHNYFPRLIVNTKPPYLTPPAGHSKIK